MSRGRILTLVLVAIILFFVASQFQWLISSWDAAALSTMDADLFALSFFILCVSMLARALTWWRAFAISSTDARPMLRDCIPIFFYGWSARYVPGKVVPVVGKVHLGVRRGYGVQPLSVSSTVDILYSTVTGVALSLIGLLVVPGVVPESFTFAALAIAGVGVATVFWLDSPHFHTLLQRSVTRIGCSLPNIDALQSRYRVHEKSELLLYYAVSDVLRGIGFGILVLSITSLPPTAIVAASAIGLIATAAGVVVIISPGGIGVTEGVGVLLLQTLLPLGVAVQVMVVARAWDLFATALAAIVAGGIDSVYRIRAPQPDV
jgi:uncharacterized membrane protein YbhN (UPF0104 family)